MSKSYDHALVPPRFLFRFAAPILKSNGAWSDSGVKLGDDCRLLSLGELDGVRMFADVRAAWSADGLLFTLHINGKRKPPWCRDSALDESDGLHVWIDTRDMQNIHRASKYCHRFAFLPGGGGRQFDRPVADQLLINRARENARPVRPRELKVVATVRKTGYSLAASISADALGGYDPIDNRQIGFQYAVVDRELGMQTFSCPPGLPYEEDPGLWATLNLVDSAGTK